VRETRAVLLDGTLDDEAGWRRSAAAAELVLGPDDVREGVAAFFERRRPAWTGR
jgi:enoyl-CoA hydratase